ncbi:MAG: DUF4232 domain-containing protein [Mycobacteriales bacterium]
MRKIVLVLPLAAAALVAGCGGSSPKAAVDVSSTPPAQASETSAVTAPPSVTASDSSAPSGPAACATADLTVSLSTPGGAAGSQYYPLHFVNNGSSACTMTGYPGVSFVAPGNGQQVGKAATRSSATTPTVTLAPGGEATATVQVGETANFSPTDCGPTPVSGLRVYPPANKTSAYVPFPAGNQSACSKDLSSTGSGQLIVRPVKAGNTGT